MAVRISQKDWYSGLRRCFAQEKAQGERHEETSPKANKELPIQEVPSSVC